MANAMDTNVKILRPGVWVTIFLFLSAFLYGVVLPLYNYSMDVYGIYRSDYTTLALEPNLNYLKTQHLLESNQRYSTLVFGTSRVGHIDFQEKLGTGVYSYNFPEATHTEQLHLLKLLLQQKHPVKNIYLGVDHASYHVGMPLHQTMHRTKIHPNGLMDGLKFHAFYLFRAPTVADMTIISGGGYKGLLNWDIRNTGRTICDYCENYIDENPEKHKTNPEWSIPYSTFGNYLEAEVSALSEFILLAKRHDIQLTIFVNPLYETTYRDLDFVQFHRFKQELADMHPYYDFSGFNAIIVDRMLYKEASHYRPQVGAMMIDTFHNAEKVTAPGAFGTYVNSQNVSLHITELERQLNLDPVLSAAMNSQKAYHAKLNELQLIAADAYTGELSESDEMFYTCHIGKVNNILLSKNTTTVDRNTTDTLKIQGWLVEPQGQAYEPFFWLKLTNWLTGGESYYLSYQGRTRHDVRAVYPYSDTAVLGFVQDIDVSSLMDGAYTVEVVGVSGDNIIPCSINRDIRIVRSVF